MQSFSRGWSFLKQAWQMAVKDRDLIKPSIYSLIIGFIVSIIFIPLIIAFKPEAQTLPVGIVSFVGVYSTEWGLVFASVVISTIPIVVAYLLMTRQFQSGLTAGAIKG